MRKKLVKVMRSVAVLNLACAMIIQFPVTTKKAYASDTTNTFVFSDSGIKVTGSGSGYSISDTTLTISSAGTYTVTGSCEEGNIVIKKGTTGVNLVLSDLTLTSAETAPIVAKKSTGVAISLSGTNTLTNNENPDNENSTDEEVADAFEGACIKAKSGSTLTISGAGTLNVNGNCKNGIKGAATTDIIVNGGTFNIDTANSGIASDGSVTINNGSLYIEVDNDGIKSEPDDDDTDSEGCIYINGGDITIKSADDAIHAGVNTYITAGTININAGDDAVHSEYLTNIGTQGSSAGPVINIESCYEGFEGAEVNMYSGSASIVSSDDGINAANSDLSNYNFAINIYGGYWYVNASGDGLDSNGDIYMDGGTVEVFGGTAADETAVDMDGTWTQKAGTIMAIGQSGMLEEPDSGKYLLYGSSGMGGQPGGQPGNMGGNNTGGSASGNRPGSQGGPGGQSQPGNEGVLWSSIFVTLLTVKIMFFTSVRIVLQKVFYNYYTNAVSHDCM